jgi:hypothetical protein
MNAVEEYEIDGPLPEYPARLLVELVGDQDSPSVTGCGGLVTG